MDAQTHRQLILDQFTRQAIPFAEIPAHSNAETNAIVLETAGITNRDVVLDVACGPGLITCDVARRACWVVGVDLTPAMLAQAQTRQQQMRLDNLLWMQADGEQLPWCDASFSVVMTRYSFHHLLHPQRMLAEMMRVCQPGGRIVVIDVFSQSPEQAAAYDELERWRDPSHVHALSFVALVELLESAGVRSIRRAFYKVEMELEQSLRASFPHAGDSDRIRERLTADVGVDRLGMGAERRGDQIWFAYPIVVLVGEKP
ncbi:class I SAM-dependent methyltransferase [Tuwongella immobilis]|uniref:Methyltransferase type 11 domain-containing protein n=1 Tax=Tuwongella immobilis TaxID=692036 RepID=A0A6C2YUL7_9BACT|nr:methyltransferase domain-containing protein [Tuwongella immobilis]VIP05428.1 methyltransferase type 11 : Methyltransferase type 11 OS=Oscillatoria nigro-viridis PCC 7112 GN=Osc7112_4200 PE=4 SV=1: Methyltransf_11 [Tuwongella immobilis]VTS08212.1 methyltransferase type 11 : Methyltransferase type 11 OS=Oscillatoria nigro-viridis PCC 7112 GN=Osc7112_4200 PE=4 SV=1: Methyltransf_11 [Tuwongella immobilis]